MHMFPFVVVAWIVAVGLYGLVTSRHLVHQIVCLIVVQSSTYVLLRRRQRCGLGHRRPDPGGSRALLAAHSAAATRRRA
jgi:multisubunit Na+/H+ antiporter MnhC subunit